MPLFLARWFLVPAGMWFASAGQSRPGPDPRGGPTAAARTNATQPSEAKAEARIELSNASVQSAIAARRQATDNTAQAKAEARVELANTSVQLTRAGRRQATDEIAQAREERQKRTAAVPSAREHLNRAMEAKAEARAELANTSVQRRQVTDEAAQAREELQKRTAEVESARGHLKRAMEEIELAPTHSASSLEINAVRDVRKLSTSLGADIERMEAALGRTREQWTRTQQQADDLVAKERELEERVRVFVNHTKVLEGHQVDWVVQNTNAAGQAPQGLDKVQKTAIQILHTAEAMDKLKQKLGDVQKRRMLATAKAKEIQQHQDDMERAMQPALRKSKRLSER